MVKPEQKGPVCLLWTVTRVASLTTGAWSLIELRVWQYCTLFLQQTALAFSWAKREVRKTCSDQSAGHAKLLSFFFLHNCSSKTLSELKFYLFLPVDVSLAQESSD